MKTRTIALATTIAASLLTVLPAVAASADGPPEPPNRANVCNWWYSQVLDTPIIEVPEYTIWFATCTATWEIEYVTNYAGDVAEWATSGPVACADPYLSVNQVVACLTS